MRQNSTGRLIDPLKYTSVLAQKAAVDKIPQQKRMIPLPKKPETPITQPIQNVPIQP